MKPASLIAWSILCSIFIVISSPGCKEQSAQVRPPAAPRNDTARQTAAADTPEIKFRYYFISYRNKDKALRDSAQAFIKSLSPAERDIIFRLNRVDAASYKRLDTMIIPERIDTSWMAYAIFPAELPILKDVHKMVFFAYYPEAFAAYENGRLVRWGPNSMGKKATPTPTGLFSANWKAREAISTVNDEWKLKWNFNVWNKGGVGWHQYQLPGYPASHSCMRLLESDAYWLYNWTDMWILKNGELAAQGTPVIIFGRYPFGKSKPWWSLVQDPAALNIPADSLTALIQPSLEKILARQAQRDSVLGTMPQKAPKDSTVISASVIPQP
jgi:hypothetical protein